VDEGKELACRWRSGDIYTFKKAVRLTGKSVCGRIGCIMAYTCSGAVCHGGTQFPMIVMVHHGISEMDASHPFKGIDSKHDGSMSASTCAIGIVR